jgi:hypothetical protein
MWTNDFITAAHLYDQFISDHQAEYDALIASYQNCDCASVTLNILIYDYFRGRRILAYALSGDDIHVQMLLAESRALGNTASRLEQAFLDAGTSDAETLCRAAYDVFSRGNPYAGGTAESASLVPGVLVNEVYRGWDMYRTIDPLRAGCDINLFSDEPTPAPTVTPTLLPMVNLTATPRPYSEYYSALDAFMHLDFEAVVGMTDAAWAQASSSSSIDPLSIRYIRAFALEELNRLDEALTEYVSIYEAAPESAWGRLARLHLEPAGATG